MALQPIPFIGPAYRARSPALSVQRCVNLYLEADESKSEPAPAALIGTPGTRLWTAITGTAWGAQDGPTRAVFPLSNGFLLVVVGAGVYVINAGGVWSSLGSLQTTTGPVSIDENGITAAMADGVSRYAVDLSTFMLSTITGGAADRVCFIDGYFVFNRSGTQQFDVYDLYTTNFTGYGAAQGSPDRLVSLIATNRELWLFGVTSTEVWVNTGNATFPFERLPQAFIQAGCAAPHSVCRVDNTVFWLGANERGVGTVWRADGYRPMRISTHAIEREIQSYGVITDAFAFSYQQEGHEFYVLTFPSADRTWAYDAATGEWHERATFDTLNVQRASRVSCVASYLGQLIAGASYSGILAWLDLDQPYEFARPLRRIRTAQHQKDAGLRRRVHRMLQVDLERGNGVPFNAATPQAMLRWSDDGGRSWSGEMWATLGALGEYQARARWRRLGSAFDRVYELTIDDPAKTVILGAVAEVE